MKLATSLVLTLGAALAAGAGQLGCASTADDAAKTSQNLSGETSGVDVPNPSGVYVASVTANGTGCPAGTWAGQISEDGQSFLVTFQAYEATVFPGVAFAIKDCTLGINIKTPSGLSFAVTSFKHAGFASLSKEGMSAKQTAKYYFMGDPVGAPTLSATLTGPYDDIFVIEDDVAIENQVWSPCGTERTLNAQTRLVLYNNADKSGVGFLDTAAVAGHVDYQFHIGLAWRQCGDAADAGPLPPSDVDAGPGPVIVGGDSDAGAPADPGAPVTDPGTQDPGAPTDPGAPVTDPGQPRGDGVGDNSGPDLDAGDGVILP
jgi:hypothetical protein